MNIIIKGTNLELHDDLKDYVNKKIGGLQKFIENVEENSVVARVELAKTTLHHQQGFVYRAEVNLDLPKKMFRSVAEREDIYEAIDDVKDELRVAINSYKDERVTKIRKGVRLIKSLKRISPMAWLRDEFKKFRK